MPRGADEGRAISPAVGVALMLVIVVAFGVVTAGMLLGFQSQLRDPAPIFASEETVKVSLQGNDTSHTLEFVHQSGQAVQPGPLRIEIGTGSNKQTIDLDSGSAAALSDGQWTAGEQLSFGLDESVVCTGGSEVADVTLRYDDGDSEYTLSQRQVPIERGQFIIRGDRVETTADYTANVKFIGTGWSSAYYDAPVNVSVRVDGSEVTAWEMIGDSDTIVGSYGVSRQSAGTTISVAASGKESRWGDWRTTSESENSEYLIVLRDGDPVPNYDAGSGQQDVATYAEPFIENGSVSLDDNQALYLFDFNRQGPNHETADYQDAIVLVSFFTQQTTNPQVHEVTEGQQFIICPAETQSANPGRGNN